MNKQQLDQLLAESETVTQELMSMRTSVLNKTYNIDYEFGSQLLSKACQHREYFRRLAETLEANRGLAQLNKQKIEKSRVMLEGLEYFKKTLKDKIQSYHTDVDSIDQYFQEPIGHIDWEKDYESGEQKLKQSLQKLKMKDQMYRNCLSNKQKLEKQIQQKSKLFNVLLPKNIKKLNEQVLQITKVFGIDTNESLEKIESIQLAYIYDTLRTLMRAEKIDVKISKQEHQYIDLVLKPCGFDLYERSLQYGIKLEQKQIKIRISSMKPEFSKLVVGVDRRSDFSNRDIFHRLMNREDIKLVFENPINETQRNVNNRFVYVDWLEGALSKQAAKCSDFIDLIRTRVFTTVLIKNIFDSFRNPVWLSTISPPVYSELSSKKILVDTIQKISLAEYQNLIGLSHFIKKSLAEYQERKLQKDKTDEAYLAFEKCRKKLIQYLQVKGIEELIIAEIYSYYKIVINYKSLKAVCILLIASEYPEISPKIKVTSLQRSNQNQLQDVSVGQIQCKASIHSKQMYSREIQIIQTQANSPLSMLNEGIKDPFGIIFCLGKLMNSIYAIQNLYIEKTKILK